MDRALWPLARRPGVLLFRGPAAAYSDYLHDEYKVGLVERGAIRISRGGRSYEIGPGQLFVLHPAEMHSGEPASRELPTWRLLCFPEMYLRRWHAAAVQPGDIGFSNPLISDPELTADFAQAHRYLERPIAALAADTTLASIVERLRSHGGVRSPTSSKIDSTAMRAVRDYLADHLDTNVSLDELAAVAGLSPFTLVRQCKMHFGVPPHQLHLAFRLNAARALILQQVSLTEAALATGFVDQAHLTRRFKRAFHLTPGSYQRPQRLTWQGCSS